MLSQQELEMEEARRGNLCEKYSMTQQVICRGLQSTIFLGIEQGTFLQVGIKVLMKSTLDTPQELAQALSEMKIHMALLPHSNVIRLLAAEETPTAVLLVTPYTPHGDLWELMKYGQTYCEIEVRNCAGQIFSGLRHVHMACDLVHGDIKPQNFLLFKVEGRFSVQLCDFGLAERPDRPGGMVSFRGIRGTSGWFSPEMLDHRDYGQAVDLFATGLILFRILGGYPPFDPPSRIRGQAEFDDRYWCHISLLCRQFVAQLLSIDPAERRTAQECCLHEWFAGPPPDEPTAEQMRALRAFGPPPDSSVHFWPPMEMPPQERGESFADLQALVGQDDMDVS